MSPLSGVFKENAHNMLSEERSAQKYSILFRPYIPEHNEIYTHYL